MCVVASLVCSRNDCSSGGSEEAKFGQCALMRQGHQREPEGRSAPCRNLRIELSEHTIETAGGGAKYPVNRFGGDLFGVLIQRVTGDLFGSHLRRFRLAVNTRGIHLFGQGLRRRRNQTTHNTGYQTLYQCRRIFFLFQTHDSHPSTEHSDAGLFKRVLRRAAVEGYKR